MIFSSTFLLIGFVGLFGAISSLIKKRVLYVLEPIEFLMITFFLEFIFMFIILLSTGKMGQHMKQIKNKLTWKEGGYMVAFSLLITGLVFAATWLAKQQEISKIAPILAIIDTCLTFLGGVYILKEGAVTKDFFAIILMVVGIGILGWN